MHQDKLGYVVADAGRAKLVVRHGPGRYETLAELEGDAAHPPRADAGGGAFDRPRSAASDLDGERSRRAQAFVRQIDQAILKAVADGAFERFVLAAPPRVLGAVRTLLAPDLQHRVVCEFAKDLTRLPERELHAHLDRLSPLGR